jgi:phytoene desaturase (3,4-didehydrolycopene-forming)
MLDVLRQSFQELGTNFDAEGLEFRRCEPINRFWFSKDEYLDLSSDMANMEKEMTRREGPLGFARYKRFLGGCRLKYEAFISRVVFADMTSWISIWRLLPYIHALRPSESKVMWDHASRTFKSEHLRKILTFESMYLGMSPFRLSSVFGLWHYAEATQGVWYPVGGVAKVVEALVSIGKRMGVTYRLGSEVCKILLSEDGSKAIGVQLQSGETIIADVIINNTDILYAYNNLLSGTPSSAQALRERPKTCSTISFYWALEQSLPQLETHNTFLSRDYRKNFDEIEQGHVPENPTFYIMVPTRIDPSAAPQGRESVVVLVPVGHLMDKSSSPNDPDADARHRDWKIAKDRVRQSVLTTIFHRLGQDIGPLIIHEQSNDPETWQSRFNLHLGSIAGLDYSLQNILCFRPSYRVESRSLVEKQVGSGVLRKILKLVRNLVWRPRYIQNLYMVGSGIHPGAGLPLCLAGARIVAQRVLYDVRK